MKPTIVLVASSTLAADAALSTMRVGPRKRNHIAGQSFEFGRPVDFDDANAAFHEVKFAHMRYLQDASFGKEPCMSLPYPGMSLPYPGMSLPFPGMSLASPCMSLPFPGMSLTYSGMSIATFAQSASPSSSPITTVPVESPIDLSSRDHIDECTPLDMTAKANIMLRLDVDSMSNGSTFLDSIAGLANEIVSYGEMHFSLCQQSGNRILSEHQTKPDYVEVTVTGLEATASPIGNVGESCTSATEGGYCTVVDLILTVYSGSNETIHAAQEEVHDEIFNQLMTGEFLNDEIIAMRLHQDDEEDVPVGLITANGGNDEALNGSSESSTNRTIIIAVLVTSAIVAMALIMLVLYRKRRAKRESINSYGSKCDSSRSTASGDDTTVQETKKTSV